jgi:hypothetical protein
MIHSTSLPLCKVIEDSVKILADVIEDVLAVMKNGERLVMLSDHGFSGDCGIAGDKAPRYGHDPANAADTIVAKMVYEKGVRRI